MDWFITTIVFLYAATGVIGLIAYLPTFKDLKNKIVSANMHSYALWTLTYGIALLYAIFVVSDFLLSLVAGIHFVSCGLIAGWVWKLNKKK